MIFVDEFLTLRALTSDRTFVDLRLEQCTELADLVLAIQYPEMLHRTLTREHFQRLRGLRLDECDIPEEIARAIDIWFVWDLEEVFEEHRLVLVAVGCQVDDRLTWWEFRILSNAFQCRGGGQFLCGCERRVRVFRRDLEECRVVLLIARFESALLVDVVIKPASCAIPRCLTSHLAEVLERRLTKEVDHSRRVTELILAGLRPNVLEDYCAEQCE